MKDALIEQTGQILDIETFLARYGMRYESKGITPICPSCGTDLHLYGAHSLQVQSQFHHHDNPPDCILAAPRDGRLFLRPKEWDFSAGKEIRAQFMQPEKLRAAYATCWKLAGGKGRLPMQKFAELVRQADKKQLWSYKGIQQWAIPYMLMTLDDFEVIHPQSRQPFRFRFVIENKRGRRITSGADILWQGGGGHAQLVMKGVRGGKPVHLGPRTLRHGISLSGTKQLIGNPDWVRDEFLNNALKMIGSPPPPPKRRAAKNKRETGSTPRP